MFKLVTALNLVDKALREVGGTVASLEFMLRQEARDIKTIASCVEFAAWELFWKGKDFVEALLETVESAEEQPMK